MIKKITLSLALTATLIQAQEVTLEPLTITSSIAKQDELSSTSSVEIYTDKDIEKARVQNIYQFLNEQTSLITMPSFGNPHAQKLDMRGYGITDGYQNIVVTLNGRRMNNIDLVPQLLSSIPPSSIKRIEILKSSGIVLNGDGANAGVINITTKQDNKKELTMYGGSFKTFGASLYLGHSDKKVSVSALLDTFRSEGQRDLTSSQNKKDEQQLGNGRVDVAIRATDALELRLAGQFSKTSTHYAGSLTKAEYDEDPTQHGQSNFGASEQKYDSNVFSTGLTYSINDELEYNVDGHIERKKSEFVTYSSVANYKYDSLKTSFDYDNDDDFVASLGAEFFEGEREGFGSTTSKNNAAAFIMTNYKFGKSSVTAGYRFEEVTYKTHSATQAQISQNDQLHGAELGYNYTFDKQNSVALSYSRSYQAPDIDRFYITKRDPTTFVAIGKEFNGFLEPMKANNYNLAYNNFTADNKLKIAVYYIDLENEIYYYSDPTFVASSNTNIDESHKYGFELYDRYVINKYFNATFNYNYVQAIIDKEIQTDGNGNVEDYSGNHLPGVSDHNVKVSLDYLPTKELQFVLTQVYRSEAYAANDFGNSFIQKQDAYTSTDIAVNYAKDNYEIFGKITNFFNQSNGLWIKDDAIYPVNFQRSVIAGLKLKF